MTQENSTSSKILSAPELRRFQHQINLKEIGLPGQEKIKSANAIVIGAGGIGAQVLQFLSASGIGNITIVDDGIVSESDIQAQTLYGGNDLGKLKTIISRQQLQHLYPLTKFEILNLRITADNSLKFLEGCDIILDATNSSFSNYLINDACIRLKKSWIYGKTNGFSGEVTVFNHRNGPSYRCLYDNSSDAETQISSPAVVYGALGCMMAVESLKLLLNSKEILSGRILNFDLFTHVFVQQTISRVEENFSI
jgi:adenylyltransferase/sulfurtransferase